MQPTSIRNRGACRTRRTPNGPTTKVNPSVEWLALTSLNGIYTCKLIVLSVKNPWHNSSGFFIPCAPSSFGGCPVQSWKKKRRRKKRDIIIKIYHCKSRIFHMHFIFVYFVHGGFCMKIKCILKLQSKSENLQRSASVRKFHAYERSRVSRIRKFSAYEIFWIYSTLN